MVLKVVRVYQDVIGVTNTENILEFSKGVIDKALTGGGGIGKSKGHNKEFKEAITGSKCCFPCISILDPDQVICGS